MLASSFVVTELGPAAVQGATPLQPRKLVPHVFWKRSLSWHCTDRVPKTVLSACKGSFLLSFSSPPPLPPTTVQAAPKAPFLAPLPSSDLTCLLQFFPFQPGERGLGKRWSDPSSTYSKTSPHPPQLGGRICTFLARTRGATGCPG